jgi:Protein of unknown function (DUF1638)
MSELCFLCCSVLQDELTTFLPRDYPEAELVFLDSMLHMHPQLLKETLHSALEQRTDRQCVLVYGDCHARMREDGQRAGCSRTTGVNCGELLLGSERYRRLRNDRAFLFLPEWAHRWREVFTEHLGFSDTTLARQFMQENHNRLVYLDTGRQPPPLKILREIEEFFAMEVEILPVSLDNLRHAVHAATTRLSR